MTKQVSISKLRTITVSFTRPADTTLYTAGDVVGASPAANINLAGMSSDPSMGGGAILMQARLISSANLTTKMDAQLFLFDTAPTAVVDNAAFAPTDAEMLTLVGVIAFPTASWVVGNAGVDAAGNAACDAQALWLSYSCLKDVNQLFGVLVTRNAYQPVSAEIFTLRLTVME